MMHKLTRVLYAAAAASLTLTTMGATGASTASATTGGGAQSTGPPGYSQGWGGYTTGGGSWFRFVSTTLTVPARTLSAANSGDAIISLNHAQHSGLPEAEIIVGAGGGPGSITVGAHPGNDQLLRLSPQVGDQVAVSIYYDQHGHDLFTATDLTQGTAQTVQMTVGNVIYNKAWLAGMAVGTVDPPQADMRLWQFTNSHVTTYTGAHGTIVGPWATSELTGTSTGTSAGTIVVSPSGLWNGGANFGAWLRALPVTYTNGPQANVGYADTGGPFRFVGTTMTMPAAQTPQANSGEALISLLHQGGPAPLPDATIQVLPGLGGGPASVSYGTGPAGGTFTVSPKPGDQLRVSIFYDQHGHYSFTATDTTQGTTQTVTLAAPYADSKPLNYAVVTTWFDTRTVAAPPADTQIWQFASSNVTTYSGVHGSILGPWATTQWTAGTSGAVVADTSGLSNAGQDFGVWLRHR